MISILICAGQSDDSKPPIDGLYGQGLKLPSLRAIVPLQVAGVLNSRLPDAVAWLLSHVAVDPFHFTYLYWTAVFGGSDTVPVHGTFAPLPWIVNAKPLAGAHDPSAVTLPTTRRFWPTTVFAFAIVKLTAHVVDAPGVVTGRALPAGETFPAASNACTVYE
jgi:hypothetical protein